MRDTSRLHAHGTNSPQPDPRLSQVCRDLFIQPQGQVSCALPEITTAVQPVPLQGGDALASTVTTPDAPGLHCANPLRLIVSILGLDNDHPDWLIGDGEGGWLKVPIAVNCTWPLGKLCASAVAGVTEIDCSRRGLPLPHPLATSSIPARRSAVESDTLNRSILTVTLERYWRGGVTTVGGPSGWSRQYCSTGSLRSMKRNPLRVLASTVVCRSNASKGITCSAGFAPSSSIIVK